MHRILERTHSEGRTDQRTEADAEEEKSAAHILGEGEDGKVGGANGKTKISPFASFHQQSAECGGVHLTKLPHRASSF